MSTTNHTGYRCKDCGVECHKNGQAVLGKEHKKSCFRVKAKKK